MQVFKDIDSIQDFIKQQKQDGRKIGLVPTMGALHNGHLSLVKKSLAETDVTIASIFVNPIQFNNPSDLEKYPRTLENDRALLESIGCHSIFHPEPSIIYPNPPQLKFDFGDLDKILEGQFRPGHFSGVGIVVAKLLNIIQPHVAYFGQKDYQQFLIIRRLVNDLNFPVRLVCSEIVREPSGLAMSSRNQRLSPEERKAASALFRALQLARENLAKKDWVEIKNEVETTLIQIGLRLEYLELADRKSLAVVQKYNGDVPLILLIAGYVGQIRLIDNLFV